MRVPHDANTYTQRQRHSCRTNEAQQRETRKTCPSGDKVEHGPGQSEGEDKPEVAFLTRVAHAACPAKLMGKKLPEAVSRDCRLDNFVGQLRKRFEGNPEQPRHFITVRGSGYRFDP